MDTPASTDERRFREPIPPVDRGPRPLWSVMIPTFNCAGYLRDTLAGVLAQDPGPDEMQIEIVDDRSMRDDPAAVVQEVGRGRVDFFQQSENVGHVRNINTCLKRSRGRLVHVLHGDDAVRPGFYAKLGQAFDARPDIGGAFCRDVRIDDRGNWQSISPLLQPESGLLEGWLERIGVGQSIESPTMVVRRQVYERLGGFDSRLSWTEDWEMWVRIAAYYPVWYEVEPLALYRVHGSSSTAAKLRSGETIRDIMRAIEINRGVLPPDSAHAISRRARRECAHASVRRARRALDAGDLRTAWAQAVGGIRCSPRVDVLAHASLLLPAAVRAAKATLGADSGRRK